MSEMNINCATCYRHMGISLGKGVKDYEFFCAVCQDTFDELPSCERPCCVREIRVEVTA